MKVAVLSSSPRRGGNSELLAEAFAEGVRSLGNEAELIRLADHVEYVLRECDECRRDDGSCSIPDRYLEALEATMTADAIGIATPLWWYGMAGTLKSFLDRTFCYISEPYPEHERVIAGLSGKRIALLIASEEAYPGGRIGLTQQTQELARYMHWELVGVVHGIGNSRGEVTRDPAAPLDAARELGRRLFELRSTDYRIDTERPDAVWGDRSDDAVES